MRLVSGEFLAFFAVAFTLHWLLPKRLRAGWLVLASYFFYARWDARFAGLLFAVTAASFLLGRAVHASRAPAARRAWVLAAVALHVGVLAYFKLRMLGADSLDALRGRNVAGWALPLGLSYYTFQSLGYVLDVARGLPAAERFLPYCLFVGFFAQITAGPIGRARVLLPQLEAPRDFDGDRFDEGCHLIVWGLFQKLFVADNLSPLVASVFDGGGAPSGAAALLGVYAFTLQLYGDFAGYSNIARGLGKCVGIDLAENFRLPFFAQDMQEHWKRWHISLSEWFADFVYRPLVDLPLGLWKFYAAPLATMLVMGLWHRFSWQMAALGLNYGVWISVTLFVKAWIMRSGYEPSSGAARALPWLNRLLTFHLVCAGFVLLRAHSLAQAWRLAASIVSRSGGDGAASDMAVRLLFFAGPLLAVEALEYARGGAGSMRRLPPAVRGLAYAGMLSLLFAFGHVRSQSFFYSAF